MSWGFPAAALILRRTEIGEPAVLGLAATVLALAAALIILRPSPDALRLGYLVFCVVFLSGMSIFAVVRYRAFLTICQENHIVEWLTADYMLAAWVAGLIITIRLARQGRPSPLAAFLTAGYFWGFWREMEWGAAFFGDKVLYTRNFFRPRAYWSQAYFDEFARSKLISGQPLLVIHWIGVIVAVLCGAITLGYLYRHRKVFLCELKDLRRAVHGRYFLAGLLIYLGAETIENLVGSMLKWEMFAECRRAHGLSDRMIGEPLEVLAALAFMLSIVTFWHAAFTGSGESANTARPVSPSR